MTLAEHLADEVENTVATRDYVEMVVTREAQNLRVEMHSFAQLNSELSNRLVTQFRWLLGWLAVVTVGILVDLLR